MFQTQTRKHKPENHNARRKEGISGLDVNFFLNIYFGESLHHLLPKCNWCKPVIFTALNPFENPSVNTLLGADAAAERVNGLNSDHPPQLILAGAVR